MKLSIITINYNNCNGLQKTIDSVVNQTCRDFEWIVIDGGSTDGSKELIEKYQENFVYWCSELDKGIYNAMNKGISKAKGDYFLFLNSGDALFSSDTLADVFSVKFTSDLIIGLVVRSDNGQIRRNHYDSLVHQLITDSIEHQGTFIKKSLFNTYRYNEKYEIVSDWAAWIEWVIVMNCSYECINKIIAVQDMLGISTPQSELQSTERSIVLKSFFNERVLEELLRLYECQFRLERSMSHPAIRGMQYLLSKNSLWFSILYRLVILFVKIHDYFYRDKSYEDFIRKKL